MNARRQCLPIFPKSLNYIICIYFFIKITAKSLSLSYCIQIWILLSNDTIITLKWTNHVPVPYFLTIQLLSSTGQHRLWKRNSQQTNQDKDHQKVRKIISYYAVLHEPITYLAQLLCSATSSYQNKAILKSFKI